MRFSLASGLLVLATATTEVVATKIVVTQIVGVMNPFGVPVAQIYYNDNRTFQVPAGGCDSSWDSGVEQFCIDPSQSRAHIIWKDQPGIKYCFKITSSDVRDGSPESCWNSICPRIWTWIYTDAACDW